MRVTKAMVDDLFALKTAADNAKARYEAELERIKAAGAAEYDGNVAKLLISKCERRTVDNKFIFEKYKVPAHVIAKHTKSTPYLQATMKELT